MRVKPSQVKSLVRKLSSDASGAAAIEFALILPIMTAVGMMGTEIGYMAMVNLQISQVSLAVADAGSRLEQTNNNSVAPTVTEADIDSVMVGADKMGDRFNLKENGRVILSSLEKDPATGKQFIHWQRCFGDLKVNSDYGNDSSNNGLNGPALVSMGSGVNKVTSPTTNQAVMFVEVFYDYKGLFGTMFIKKMRFKQEAAYLVRDIRDLRASNVTGVTGGGGKSTCA